MNHTFGRARIHKISFKRLPWFPGLGSVQGILQQPACLLVERERLRSVLQLNLLENLVHGMKAFQHTERKSVLATGHEAFQTAAILQVQLRFADARFPDDQQARYLAASRMIEQELHLIEDRGSQPRAGRRFARAPQHPRATAAIPPIAACFQVATVVRWMPCIAPISARICALSMASGATRAMNRAVCCLRVTEPISRLPYGQDQLNQLSKIPAHVKEMLKRLGVAFSARTAR